MRYLIKFSYDGSNYKGYQIQPNHRTIQEELETALQKVNNNIHRSIQSTGRTDKGVHAKEQYAHFDIDITITTHKLKRALNSNLPNDIHIINVYEVDDHFHARYQVKEKEYNYYINLGEYNPIERNYVFQYNYKLNIENMRKAIVYFVGKHDFRAFATDSKDKENCIRNISHASIEQDKENSQKYIFIFRGNGFLRYQVRNMVGILIKVGEEKIKPEMVKTILESKNRNKLGVTAPAEGLYLKNVSFKNKI
ncbi:MAG: tRNA pseudouridine(38-40) synthase TruA [Bacilli bacterium]|nr:tRNA pseudouridine(38-40) synthase TruA [Bacilli bacterium]